MKFRDLQEVELFYSTVSRLYASSVRDIKEGASPDQVERALHMIARGACASAHILIVEARQYESEMPEVSVKDHQEVGYVEKTERRLQLVLSSETVDVEICPEA